MRIGISGPQDFIALLIRRKWWIIGPFLVMSSILAILVYELPKTFVSTSLILVRPRDVPENMVVDLVSGSAEARLKQIEQILLSRNNLQQVLEKFGTRLTDHKRGNVDAQIDRLRFDIKIEFQIAKAQGNRKESTVNFFRISYQNQEALLAQQVTRELVRLVIDQDRDTREVQVNGTTTFLSDELVKVKGLLDTSADKLKDLKAGRQFELPENLPTNLKALDRLQLDKQGNAEAIDRAIGHQTNLEQQIAQTPEFLIKVSAPLNSSGRGPAAAPGPPKDPLLEDFLKAQAEYDKQAALNKETHPDVRTAKARLERAKGKLPPEVLEAVLKGPDEAPDPGILSGAVAPTTPANEERVPNPAYEKLQADLRLARIELTARNNEKLFIASQMKIYTARVDATPQAELQIVDVERENKDLQRRYEDLNGKLGAAKLSESLETAGKGSFLNIQDEPNYPLDPAKPNKPAVFLGSCLLSLAFAIGFAFTVDVARQRVRTQTEIEAIWAVPVLIDIPQLVTDSDLAVVHKQKIRFATYASVAVVLQGLLLYVVVLKHNGILDRLEPVLQKLVYR